MNDSPIVGCRLGTAVGDALGLPYEGLSRRRASRLLGAPDRHRFLFRRGMFTDDTELTCLAAQSLIASGGESDEFARDFARRLKWWLLFLPAGIGFATLRAILRLWFGRSAETSGVFSAGNGAAMRAAIVGAAFDDLDQIVQHVRASTRITHTDPKAEAGALAIAFAAFRARAGSAVAPHDYVHGVSRIVGAEGSELTRLLHDVALSVMDGKSTREFADALRLEGGVSGYVYHTIPVVVHAWLLNQHDFHAAVTSVIACGGDTDTSAAIVGGIIGTRVGKAGIPPDWLRPICDWPRSINWIERLGRQHDRCRCSGRRERPIRLHPVALLLRNVMFLAVVLIHGFRRLFPPS